MPDRRREPRSDGSQRRREFKSDGCTLSPEGAWHDCCVEHDKAYFCGGSAEDKLKADQALRDCIRAKGYPITAAIFYRAVRVFGHHFWPRVMKPSALIWAGPVKRTAIHKVAAKF